MTCTHGMLTPASCIDCMDDDGLGAPTTAPERLEGPSVASKYDTECRKCDGSIWVGERVHLTDAGRWVCERCAGEIQGGAMTTVRVEAIHPKCLAQLPGLGVLAGCECMQWEERDSWWLCPYHDSFNDGCWAVADSEPKTWEELFADGVSVKEWDAYGAIIDVPGCDDYAYVDKRECGVVDDETHRTAPDDIRIACLVRLNAAAPRVRMTDAELRAAITELLKGNE